MIIMKMKMVIMIIIIQVAMNGEFFCRIGKNQISVQVFRFSSASQLRLRIGEMRLSARSNHSSSQRSSGLLSFTGCFSLINLNP